MSRTINPKQLCRQELDPAFPFERAKGIRMLALDVDGVLTDGGLYYDDNGLLLKRFDTQDGLGLRVAALVDIESVIISGMKAGSTLARGKILNITECHVGVQDKVECLDQILAKRDFGWEQVAFVGDDWVDLDVMSRCGLSLSVASAQPEVRAFADYVSPLRGGEGAVRQLARHLVAAQGRLVEVLQQCLSVRND